MALNVTALCLIVFCVLTIILGIVKLHEYPGKIAAERNHPQHDAIVACSVLGLLVFPLWMFALVWAYAGVIGQPLAQPEPAAAKPPARSEADEGE